MGPLPSMLDFVLAIAAAFAAGALVRRLRQPPLLGYLIAGIVLGPSALGLIADTNRISTLAQIGVAFLMFQAGTELSISQLRKMQGIAIAGPWVQLALMAPFVVLAVVWTHWPATEVSYLGIIVALSSTTVLVKLLTERGELDTPHGRIGIAYSMVQDLPMIPAIVIFTSLGAVNQVTSLEMTGSIVAALGKAIGFVVVAYAVGTKVVPPVLRRIAAQGGELLLLAVIAIALGMAYLSNLMGISLVLGAFIAGLVVAESEVNYRVLKEVSPISDLFVTFFFVSVGMLLDISFVVTHLHQVLLIVGVIMVGKTIVLILVGTLFRQPARTAVLFGLGLGQIGEEAFLLAQVGLAQGVLGTNAYSLVLSGAVLSIVLSPMLMSSFNLLLAGLERIPLLGRAFDDLRRDSSRGWKDLSGHAVVCGYGQVGQELVQALERRGVRYVVIDREPHNVAMMREKGVPYVLGDATRVPVLNRAGLLRAGSLAITLPDPDTAENVVRSARRLRKGLPIVARGTGSRRVVEQLLHAGATEVVHPGFEASLEFIRTVLRGSGVPPREVDRTVLSNRIGFYG